MRYIGLTVNDCPTFLSPNQESTHSVSFPEENIHLYLEMHGCISYSPTCLPSRDEIDQCTWLNLTSDEVLDPYSDVLQERQKSVARNNTQISRIFMTINMQLENPKSESDLIL